MDRKVAVRFLHFVKIKKVKASQEAETGHPVQISDLV
jgi:hypothetical protein